MTGLIQRLRTEEGFGLVELMISLVVLNVGILAVVAAFNGGSLALLRCLRDLDGLDARRQADGALPRDPVFGDLAQHDSGRRHVHRRRRLSRDAGDWCVHRAGRGCVHSHADHEQPSTPPSPDGRSYRIDTYIITQTPTRVYGRALKRVTVVVRRSSPLKTLARVSSNFDQSTG